MAETDEERIKGMVAEAKRLQKQGENEEALQLLHKAWDESEIESLPRNIAGLISRCEGRILRIMGRYNAASIALKYTAECMRDNLIDYANAIFELFACMHDGDIQISDEEVQETRAALIAAMFSNEAKIEDDIGNMMQNLAWIEQLMENTEKAIIFYKMALAAREEAGDARGYALTQACLVECYVEAKSDWKIIWKYADSALEYFGKIGDTERIEQIHATLDAWGRVAR